MAETTPQGETVGEHMVDVAEHGGGMPQLDFDTWASQIFWTALALVLLYQILVKKILPRISGALEDRHNAITDDLDRAAELKRQAEDAEAAYKKALADARADANRIVEQNRAEINAEIEAENAKAEAEIAARAAEGEKRIAEIRAEAAENARGIAEDAARAIIERLAPGAANDNDIAASVSRALEAKGLAR